MYYKKINTKSNKECFNYLSNHFAYDTMNSWNGVTSIANNVKVYNLPVDDDEALQALEEDNYNSINMTILEWEAEHHNCSVGFAGRSGGYLVLYPKKGCQHVFHEDSCSPCFYDNYESWKKDVQEQYGSLKAYHNELMYQVKLVQDFDKLCDNLIDVLKELIEEMKHRHERTFKWNALARHIHYTYETLEDLRNHKAYMLQHNAKVFDEDEESLYVEYEIERHEEGEVTIMEEDE